MKLTCIAIAIVLNILSIGIVVVNGQYDATWASLETRPLPSWYDGSKIGIFIHWGVYSVPGFAGYEDHASHYPEWFWNDWYYGSTSHKEFMSKFYPPNFTYQDFATEFKAEFFDPYQWADIFKKAGAKYIVLTSKHHEGYSLYPSKYGFSWNSQDIGPNRDLVGDLAKAMRETTEIKFGLYHSRYEWFNPLFQSDKSNQFRTDEFVQYKTLPELYELVNLYKPDVVWSDGQGDAHSDYWKAKEFLAWLYNESPVNMTVVTNDRWGNETLCTHGGFMTCDDHYNPGVLQPRKWESCMTLDRHAFGIRRNARIADHLSP
jgi:alpha-L-fucosidase